MLVYRKDNDRFLTKTQQEFHIFGPFICPFIGSMIYSKLGEFKLTQKSNVNVEPN